MGQKHLKPLYWGLFSVGGTVAALALAPLILVICILLPLGAIGDANRFYQNLHDVIANPLVYVILAILIFTLLWHGVHRFYYILHDLHINVGSKTRLLFYTIAMVALALTIYHGIIR